MFDEPPAPTRARVSVLLPYPFAGPFDYRLPQGMELSPGDHVLVPLNRREEVGVVWDSPGDTAVGDNRLRPISGKLDAPPMREDLRRLIDWIAAYTISPPGDVLAMALRINALRPDAPPLGWRRAEAPPEARLTPHRKTVLAELTRREPRSTADLAQSAGVTPAIIRAMADLGLLIPAPLPIQPGFQSPDPNHQGPTLSPDQAQAAAALREAVRAKEFSVTLLEGVTGSGKTEVYQEAIAECLRQGRQILVLLPEIALSAQWTTRFAARFGTPPAMWHSDLTQRTRRLTWRAVADGAATVVVGARSALFLPFPDLGLVIIDEEHETAFKQEDGVIYNARDMAIVRARLCQAPVILASATPSLESISNAEAGRYRRLHLPNRHGGATMPDIELVDLRENPPDRGDFLSPRLIAEIRANHARNEQSMLFLNRRGYAPLTLCRRCGHRFACPNCTAWLVEHRARKILACHHCGHTQKTPDRCPACDTPDTLAPIGPGVERITEEATRHFPEARILVMASDTITGPNAAAEAARKVSDREIDLVIGTQIVAKGWHFPHLTLVGVVDADLGLAGGDLRAAERTVQLLHQVAGRAGRAEAPGRVLLQTFNPTHPVMQALKAANLKTFIQSEQAERRPGNWPPYGRLAALIISADTPDAADRTAQNLAAHAPTIEGLTILGPAPAPLAVLRGRHRRRLLLKARKDIQIQPILRAWLAQVPTTGTTKIDIDIDPVSFL